MAMKKPKQKKGFGEEDLPNFDTMSAFEELLPENIDVTKRLKKVEKLVSGKTSGNEDVQTRFAEVVNKELD